MRMLNAGGPCWRGKLSKRNWSSQIGIVPLLLLALTGCAANLPSGTPRLPAPAADLMQPAPTGSAYLESVSAELKALDDDLARWEKTLQAGPTK
ncbi:Uncharacterised protein [Bordetella trematum]|uniref:Uncharacterized protein n=1 Tax=Bordetella trematum TaxID=123899 RepID=A0A157SP85_9BORD|nr:Uncharacterised protein [Bordetella trematum]SUV97909.1 Uncharacterised protein [Bordetella trematum]SUX91998.1 Uncharacterised protein [Bordetella trematum]